MKLKIYDRLIGWMSVSAWMLAMCCAVSCTSEQITNEGSLLPEKTYPLLFNVAVDGHESRAGGKDTWIQGDEVGVQLGTKQAVYKITSSGTALEPKDAEDTLYWENSDKALVKAWYPAEKKENWDISNQSNGYTSFDCLYAEKEMDFMSTGEDATLHFTHLMSKVECTVKSDASLTVSEVTFFGASKLNFEAGVLTASSGLVEITPESDNGKYTAILYPRQMQNQYFIVVCLSDGSTFVYKPTSETDGNLQAGKLHKYEIKVVKGEVNVSASGVASWTEEPSSQDAAQKQSYHVILPKSLHDGYVITDLSNDNPITVQGNSFSVSSAGFSITYTETDLSKGFSILKGIGEVKRTYNNEDSNIEYTFSFTNLKRDLTLSYGEYIQVGDYYFSDNTCSVLPTKDGATCIGIVFHVGTGAGDSKGNYAGTSLASNGIRGYAVALKDAHESAGIWGPRKFVEGIESSGSYVYSYLGYKNSMLVKSLPSFGDAVINEPTKSDTYWAFKVALEYTVASPEGTSGWYLPSIGQLVDISRIPEIETSMLSAGGYGFKTDHVANEYGAKGGYWSSSEKKESDAWYFSFEDMNCEAWSKNQEFAAVSYVRPVLTF